MCVCSVGLSTVCEVLVLVAIVVMATATMAVVQVVSLRGCVRAARSVADEVVALTLVSDERGLGNALRKVPLLRGECV